MQNYYQHRSEQIKEINNIIFPNSFLAIRFFECIRNYSNNTTGDEQLHVPWPNFDNNKSTHSKDKIFTEIHAGKDPIPYRTSLTLTTGFFFFFFCF